MKRFALFLIPLFLFTGIAEATASSQFKQTGQAVFNTNPDQQTNTGEPKQVVSDRDKYYAVLYNHILRTARAQGPEWADWMAQTIIYYCEQYGVDPLLIGALFTQESSFSLNAYSPAGALSIAQLMPDTARQLGITPQEAWSDPEKNIEAGIRYVAYLLNRYSYAGAWCNTYAIAAYNAGPGAVTDGLPPYEETINHVYRVGEIFQELINEYDSMK